MPALPVIDDVFRTALIWSETASGSNAVNVLHFYAPGKTAAQLNTALTANVATNMWKLTENSCVITRVDITKLDGSSATLQTPTSGVAPWVGGTGTTQAIQQGAYIVKLGTETRGRSYRGRVYLPFLAESQSDRGILVAASVANVTTAWSTFMTAMTTAGFQLVVASYKLSVKTTVVSVGCEAKAATQRRRQKR